MPGFRRLNHSRARTRAPGRPRSTKWNSSLRRRCSGMSSMSCSLSAGRSRARCPARCAASAFSFRPPIGSTWPVSVISPVIATSSRTRRPVTQRHERGRHRDAGARAVLRGRAGRHVDVDVVLGEPVVGEVRREPLVRGRAPTTARPARDSCITSPSWPVIISLPLPGDRRRLDEQHVAADRRPRQAGRDARLRRAPPRLGEARALAEQLAHLARRRSTTLPFRPCPRRSARATLRQIVPISRSSSRTPASRV